MPLSDLFSSSSRKRSNSQGKENKKTNHKGPPGPFPRGVRTAESPPKAARKAERLPRSPYPDLSNQRHSRYASPSPSTADIHPLNLPPAERERRRSAMSTGEENADSNGMNGDYERDPDEASDNDSSGEEETPRKRSGYQLGGIVEDSDECSQASPYREYDPDLDGDSDSDEARSPTPPQHKFTPIPPKPPIDPEACKALGNKYFKAKDYAMAVSEYTKGW